MSHREIFLFFLKLGFTGFGGPLALAAQMQQEAVEERGWISLEEFQKAFALIKAMPGALAFSTAVYLGRRAGGRIGGALAGVGLILPSATLLCLLAYFSAEAAGSPLLAAALGGMQASALALILLALRSLIAPYLKKTAFWILGAIGAYLFWQDLLMEPVLIVGFGLLGALAWVSSGRALLNAGGVVFAQADPEFLKKLGWICFKAGAFVFGTGVAIAPLLERDFVTRQGWITGPEFMNALALGQVTPGPVLLTTTYLGFQLAGILGALVATVSVYFASFFHMMTWFPPAVGYLSKQKWIDGFLYGALAAVAGTIVVTVVRLGGTISDQPWRLAWIVVAFGLGTYFRKFPSWGWIFVGAFLGMLLPS